MRGEYIPFNPDEFMFHFETIRGSEEQHSLRIPLLITVDLNGSELLLLQNRAARTIVKNGITRPLPRLVLPSFEPKTITRKSTYGGMVGKYVQDRIFTKLPILKREIFPLGYYKSYVTDLDGKKLEPEARPRRVTQLPAHVNLTRANNFEDPPMPRGTYRYFNGESKWIDLEGAFEAVDKQAYMLPEDNLALDSLGLVTLLRKLRINADGR